MPRWFAGRQHVAGDRLAACSIQGHKLRSAALGRFNTVRPVEVVMLREVVSVKGIR
jgi:hypothetical protein